MTILTLQPDGAAGIDAQIYSGSSSSNYGTLTTFIVGCQVTSYLYRTLLKFDLSSIPVSAIINSAVLSLWIKADLSANARTFRVYRILRNWTEAGVTWNKYDGTNSWSSAGASTAGSDYDSASLGSADFSASESGGTEKQFSLSATEIKKLIDGTYTNYGFILRADTENQDGYQFYSSDDPTYPTLRPKFVVNYTTPGGNRGIITSGVIGSFRGIQTGGRH